MGLRSSRSLDFRFYSRTPKPCGVWGLSGVRFELAPTTRLILARRSFYLPAVPDSPALFNAAKTSFALKLPVTSKDSAPFAAVFPFTPVTLDNASFTVVTHLLQQRCTPLTLSDSTFPSFAPVLTATL